MKIWLLKRILMLLFIFWGITTITFIIMNVVPRNPAIAMSGSFATGEQIEKFNKQWGLDKPFLQRYVLFYAHLLKGDLGTSIRTEIPVITEIKNYLPATMELTFFSIGFTVIIGVTLGIVSALKRNKAVDQITRFLSLIGVSTPNFWLGLLLLLLFYYKLGWVGPGRTTLNEVQFIRITGFYLFDSLITRNWPVFIDSLKHIILPSFAIGFFGLGVVARQTRSAMLDVINKDYIKAARARGLSTTRVLFKHALRNALIPVITMIGLIFGGELAGSVVIEVVFSWPGLGLLAYNSILKADQPVILGVTLAISFFYSVSNLFVDIIYRYLDPKIKYE